MLNIVSICFTSSLIRCFQGIGPLKQVLEIFENPRIHFPSQPPVASAIHQNHTIGAWLLNGPHDLTLFICQMANGMGMIHTCHCCHCSIFAHIPKSLDVCFSLASCLYVQAAFWRIARHTFQINRISTVHSNLPRVAKHRIAYACLCPPAAMRATWRFRRMRLKSQAFLASKQPQSFQNAKAHSNNQPYAKFNS